jgi:AMMECR1 domain-containing protein
MSRSVLLQLARDSIQEVLEAQRTINYEKLLEEHPLLNEIIQTTVKIFINDKLRGSYASTDNTKTLIEDIVYNAKKAAFEDSNFTPMSTSEYLHCVIELSLHMPEGIISEKDPAILNENSKEY